MNTSLPRTQSSSSALNSPFAKYVKRVFTLNTGGRYLSTIPRTQRSLVLRSFSRLICWVSFSLSSAYRLEMTSFFRVKRCLYMWRRWVMTSFAKASPPGHATTARSVGSEYGIIQSSFVICECKDILLFYCTVVKKNGRKSDIASVLRPSRSVESDCYSSFDPVEMSLPESSADRSSAMFCTFFALSLSRLEPSWRRYVLMSWL